MTRTGHAPIAPATLARMTDTDTWRITGSDGITRRFTTEELADALGRLATDRWLDIPRSVAPELDAALAEAGIVLRREEGSAMTLPRPRPDSPGRNEPTEFVRYWGGGGN